VDIARTGWNSKETTLNPKNVPQLKLVGTIHTVAPCTTQLLYYENLNLNGHKNVLFCWTNGDNDNGNSTVYAFDADTYVTVWQLFVGLNSVWTTHAPVIDSSNKNMFFIYKNNNDNGYNYLIGVDIMTGKMLPDSPKLINASVAGTGDASVGGRVPFQNTQTSGRIHNDCRTSLLLLNGVLFFGFAHNSDSYPYHGWVFAYKYDTSAKRFDQVAYYCTTPNAGLGGVWMAGQGIASDGKSIFYTTGNGDFNPSKDSMSMAVIKMSPSFVLEDYFVPAKWKPYSDADLDLGGCGPTLIPNTHYLIVGVTKYGGVHLIDQNKMGKFTADKDSCKQSFQLKTGYVVPGGNPVVWSTNANGAAKIYMWAPGIDLAQFTYNPSTELLEGPVYWRTGTTSGGGLFLSSNGMSDAVLWAYSRDGIFAFDASKDVSAGPIWNSKLVGPSSFGWPLVVNGKAYTIGFDSKVSVFGV